MYICVCQVHKIVLNSTILVTSKQEMKIKYEVNRWVRLVKLKQTKNIMQMYLYYENTSLINTEECLNRQGRVYIS